MVKLKYIGKAPTLVRLERSGEKVEINPGESLTIEPRMAADLLRAYPRHFKDLTKKGKIEGALDESEIETAEVKGGAKGKAAAEAKKPEVKEPKEPVAKTTIVTQELLDEYPELVAQGAKIGDEIELEEEEKEEAKKPEQSKAKSDKK